MGNDWTFNLEKKQQKTTPQTSELRVFYGNLMINAKAI